MTFILMMIQSFLADIVANFLVLTANIMLIKTYPTFRLLAKVLLDPEDGLSFN